MNALQILPIDRMIARTIARMISGTLLGATLSLLVLAPSACKKEDALHKPELTRYSRPIPGMLPYFRGRIMDPIWPKTTKLPEGLRGLRSFKLTAHDGKPFTATQLRGQYVLVNFFYATCTGICPAITANIKKLSGRIPNQKGLRFVSITVNPELDDPKALRLARDRFGIMQPNWTFLTGDRPQIERLARDQFAGEIKTREGLGRMLDFVHTENIFLVDDRGYLRGIYRARALGDFKRLLKELKSLRKADRAT